MSSGTATHSHPASIAAGGTSTGDARRDLSMTGSGTATLRMRDTGPSDEAIVKRVLGGERELYELLMRRHNQRVYRVARSIVRDEAEAEDVMQEAYLRAYSHLDQFEGRASFATWLTRIAVHEALARVRRKGRFVGWDDTMMEERELPGAAAGRSATPEDELGREELRRLLAEAIDALPLRHRLVFVLREVEGMSTGEVARSLDISPENVKVRLHRARAALRDDIDRRVGRHAPELFAFHLSRCDRIVKNVFARLASASWRGGR